MLVSRCSTTRRRTSPPSAPRKYKFARAVHPWNSNSANRSKFRLLRSYTMKCPYCASKTKITNSRPSAKTLRVWRRHACTSCSAVFTTYESLSLADSHRVETSTGRLISFSRPKLLLSIYRAVDHRQTAENDCDELTDTVCTALLAYRSAVLPTEQIRTTVLKVLKQFDAAAAVKYQANHQALTQARDVRRALRR